MPFVPSRDGLCLSFIGHVNVCPFSLSRSPRCSRFVFLVFSSLSYFLALIVWETRGFLLLIFDPLVFIYFPGAAAAAAGRAMLQGLCCRGCAAGAMLQGPRCRGYAAGALLQGLCCGKGGRRTTR